MYCKHCGKEITDDSKFCRYCGKSQENGSKPYINKQIWIIYLIWVIANLYLLMGEKSRIAASYFYPFTANHRFHICYSWDKEFYDFSEFIVYVFVIPFLIYLIYRRINR